MYVIFEKKKKSYSVMSIFVLWWKRFYISPPAPKSDELFKENGSEIFQESYAISVQTLSTHKHFHIPLGYF